MFILSNILSSSLIGMIILSYQRCYSQVLQSIRPQPSPLSLESIYNCCQYQNDINNLLTCVNGTKSMIKTDASVYLVTYLDSEKGSSFDIPDILKFGSYMLANTAAYAEQNNYGFRWLNIKTGSNYQPGDARWNKVKIIEKALDPIDGWAKDAQYLVWLDADAIVLDLGLSIEEIGKQFPKADFIASADIRQGYLNSGFLLMRNTPWLRNFVTQWWDIVDRSVKCDQDAFDILYDSYQARYNSGETNVGNIREKVAILDRDALNSDPPAMTNQKDYNQVLHLMGEITPQRQKIFQHAFSNICQTFEKQSLKENNSILPNQLGVTREFLLSTASDVYSLHVEKLMSKASATDPRPTVDAFNDLSVACHHLVDIYKTINTPESLQKYRNLYKKAYEITIDWLRDFEKNMKNSPDRYNIATIYIYMLKRTAENGNDYFHSLELSQQELKKTVAEEVLQILRVLYNILNEASRPFALHMTSLMYHNLGEMTYNLFIESDRKSKESLDLLEEGLSYELKAINAISTHFEDTDNKSIMREYISMLQLTAIYQCSINDYENAIKTWNKTLQKAEALAGGVVISYHFHHLIGYYFNAAMCDFTSQHLILAKERFERLLEIAKQIGYDPENPPGEILHSIGILKEIQRIAVESPKLMEPFTFSDNDQDADELDEWEECQPGEEGCEEVEVDTDGNILQTQKSPRAVSVDELDEWEECQPGEEGCEEVEVDINEIEDEDEDEEEEDEEDQELAEIRAQYLKQSQRFHSNDQSDENNNNSHEIKDDDEEDDDEDEEEKELAEIRAQYMKQSKRFQNEN